MVKKYSIDFGLVGKLLTKLVKCFENPDKMKHALEKLIELF